MSETTLKAREMSTEVGLDKGLTGEIWVLKGLLPSITRPQTLVLQFQYISANSVVGMVVIWYQKKQMIWALIFDWAFSLVPTSAQSFNLIGR